MKIKFTSFIFCILTTPVIAQLWSDNGLHIHNTNNGNVGIGISSPLSKLDVVGQLRAYEQIHIGENYDLNNGRGITIDHGGSTDWGFLTLRNSHGTHVKILGNGNVGISTATPKHKLHVKGRIYLEGTDELPSGWLQNYFHWKGHSLIMGSEEDVYAHNIVELKPGGSVHGSLFSQLLMFQALSPGNHELKIQLSTIGDSFLMVEMLASEPPLPIISLQ